MVADLLGSGPLGVSKNPAGPVLVFDRAEWRGFAAGVRDGEFDLA